MIKKGASNEEIVTKLFTAALAREPSPKELESLTAVIDEYAEDRATALQDARLECPCQHGIHLQPLIRRE